MTLRYKQLVPISRAQIEALDDFASGPIDDADKAVLAYIELSSIENQTKQLNSGLLLALQKFF